MSYWTKPNRRERKLTTLLVVRYAFHMVQRDLQRAAVAT